MTSPKSAIIHQTKEISKRGIVYGGDRAQKKTFDHGSI